MHEANFELIEIPHVRQSGKNSADIRLVVDALDLCYTKSHVNTFVIISGDSDFSPLVSKLRENAKHVIGVGVKQSTSDHLLVANCDDFIFYDDLVREMAREMSRGTAKRETRETQPAAKRTPDEEKRRRQEADNRKSKGVDIAVQTFDALLSERGDKAAKIWASVLKDAIKRRKPDFNESYYGFRAFGNLLEEAQRRGLLEIGRDEKSGAFVFRNNAGDAQNEDRAEQRVALEAVSGTYTLDAADVASGSDDSAPASSVPASSAPGASSEVEGKHKAARKPRGSRKPAVKKPKAGEAEAGSAPSKEQQTSAQAPVPAPEVSAPNAPVEGVAAKKPRTVAPRSRRPRKAAPPAGGRTGQGGLGCIHWTTAVGLQRLGCDGSAADEPRWRATSRTGAMASWHWRFDDETDMRQTGCEITCGCVSIFVSIFRRIA